MSKKNKRKRLIIAGRTSGPIAEGLIRQFGDGSMGEHGPLITQPGKIIQSRFGTFGDGEAIFELFADGKLPDHPIEQKLSIQAKKDIVKSLKGANVTIVHSLSGANTSSRAISLLHGVRALKEQYGVDRIKVIAPQLPFMRNDRPFSKVIEDGPDKGEVAEQYNAVASRYYATDLRFAGVDKLVGFEPHSKDGAQHYRDVFGDKNVKFVKMGNFFAKTIGNMYQVDKDNVCYIIVGSPDGMNKPDDYGIARASSFGAALYAGTKFDVARNLDLHEKPYMFGISKTRISPKETKITDFYGNVEGKVCVIIDDIISSGGTILDAARKLKEHGAIRVIAVATHAVLINDSLGKLLRSEYIDKLLLTDTIPGALEKVRESGFENDPKLSIETISPLVNKSLERHFGL